MIIGNWLYRLIDDPTAIATFALFAVTFMLWRATLGLVKGAEKTARQQLRAYLSVTIGSAVYQDSAKRLRFEAKPMIINAGQTPAYKVRYESKAEIIPDSLVTGYSFTPPSTSQMSQSSIGPRENRYMSAIVQNTVPKKDIKAIKDGNGQALWVWGVVHYEDIFGDPHFTEFCQRLVWLGDQIYGIYDPQFGQSN